MLNYAFSETSGTAFSIWKLILLNDANANLIGTVWFESSPFPLKASPSFEPGVSGGVGIVSLPGRFILDSVKVAGLVLASICILFSAAQFEQILTSIEKTFTLHEDTINSLLVRWRIPLRFTHKNFVALQGLLKKNSRIQVSPISQ